MGSIKWIFVLYSLGAILAMVFIGVSVALRSIPLILISIVLFCLVMGYGFKTKKKMRDQGLL